MLDDTLFFRSIDSTNLEASRRRDDNIGRNVLFIADEQTAGRGQHNRNWESQSGKGLWATLFLGKPDLLIHNLHLLSLYTGIIIQRSILAITDIRSQLKWPNDIMINDKKCGGILTEVQWKGAKPHSAIIGMGINLSQGKDDFSANIRTASTSLLIQGADDVDRDSLIREITEKFFLSSALLEQPELLTRDWNDLAWKNNELVHWQQGEEQVSGIFLGVNELGQAVIDVNSLVETFSSGEIRWKI